MYEILRLQASTGGATVQIPEAMLERSTLKPGERILLVQTEEGILVVPYDPTLVRALDAGQRGMVQYARALRALTK